jgi:hypothetical protein
MRDIDDDLHQPESALGRLAPGALRQVNMEAAGAA